jgi:hypothetical protein
MGEPIAVLALRRKRDLISGTIAKYEKLILAAQHDLAHVNSALRLFEVTGEAADLPPYVEPKQSPTARGDNGDLYGRP